MCSSYAFSFMVPSCIYLAHAVVFSRLILLNFCLRLLLAITRSRFEKIGRGRARFLSPSIELLIINCGIFLAIYLVLRNKPWDNDFIDCLVRVLFLVHLEIKYQQYCELRPTLAHTQRGIYLHKVVIVPHFCDRVPFCAACRRVVGFCRSCVRLQLENKRRKSAWNDKRKWARARSGSVFTRRLNCVRVFLPINVEATIIIRKCSVKQARKNTLGCDRA